jgi:hypothetical protein
MVFTTHPRNVRLVKEELEDVASLFRAGSVVQPLLLLHLE